MRLYNVYGVPKVYAMYAPNHDPYQCICHVYECI